MIAAEWFVPQTFQQWRVVPCHEMGWPFCAWKALQSEAMVTGHEVLGKKRRGRCAWNFRANESNQVYLNCRVPPKISKKRHYAIGHGQYHWRTAFQAEHLQWLFPRTSSPVIVASLRTAFQAVNTLCLFMWTIQPLCWSRLCYANANIQFCSN